MSHIAVKFPCERYQYTRNVFDVASLKTIWREPTHTHKTINVRNKRVQQQQRNNIVHGIKSNKMENSIKTQQINTHTHYSSNYAYIWTEGGK